MTYANRRPVIAQAIKVSRVRPLRHRGISLEPTIDVLLAFAVTTALFAFIPGPAMLYAAARTMAGGRRAGLMAVLGINIGAYVHVIAAAAGLSALFNAVPVAYTIVKLVGALYLIWLVSRCSGAKKLAPKLRLPPCRSRHERHLLRAWL